jgi:SAM-dependent MidA family methyltransferase
MSLIENMKGQIVAAGGWIGFDRFMHEALYAPGLGYYSGGRTKLGFSPEDGSDFVTAPELSPLFGRAWALQIEQAMRELNVSEVWEFGAGSGALAAQILDALGERISLYHIVEVSADLQARQRARLGAHAQRVVWETNLPETLCAVVIGNEVLDAMPVQILCRKAGIWYERGVALSENELIFSDRATTLRPPLDIDEEGELESEQQDYLTEIHPQAEAFIRSIGERLVRGQRGALFLADYGFPEREYYHPQRSMGTLMCHHAHQADDNPLVQVGQKDITAHINFTGIAVAAESAGLELLGYTSQGHFLANCGIGGLMQNSDLPTRIMAQKLIQEHEMGELFKFIGFAIHGFDALGFLHGDRSHKL